MIRWFNKIWEGLIEPAWIRDARECHLSRVLNVILLIFLAWGILFEIVDSTPKCNFEGC